MWKDYSLSYIKNNRAGSISIFVSVFIAALFLSFLCSLFYNFWQDEIHRIQLEEGDWHGRITGNIKEEDIKFIQNYANVKTVEINQELSEKPSDGQELVVDICFYNVKTAVRDMERIAEALKLEKGAAVCHLQLLAMYFVRDPQDKAPRLLFPAYLVIVIITCLSLILIIHNSFAVSMNARIKQFGIFSSIGATPAQIFTCLMQEAGGLALIPSILGLLLGIILCFGVVSAMNAFVVSADIVGGRETVFQYHPAIFAVTCIISVVTIFFSAWLPARKLSKLTVLEAIHGMYGIYGLEIKRKKNFRMLSALFGLKGELAGLALYAQKKALRTSTLSLTLSFFAFTIMMCLFTLSGISTEQTYFQRYESAWDIMMTIKDTNIEDFALEGELQKLSGVRSCVAYQKAEAKSRILEEWRSEEIKALTMDTGNTVSIQEKNTWLVNAPIVIMEDTGFIEYCGQIGITPSLDGAVVINRIWDSVNSDFRHHIYIPYVKEDRKITALENAKGEMIEIPVIAYTDKTPVLREEYGEYDNFVLVHVMSVTAWKRIAKTIGKGNVEKDLYLRVLAEQGADLSALNELEERIVKIIGNAASVESENRIQEKITNDKMIHGMMGILGAFCVLIAMIGIANVFSNTLNFLRQRKREFARYLSIGMTVDDMKSLFCMEALIIAGRPLLITLPLTIAALAFMLKASHLEAMVFLANAPILPIFVFLFFIAFFVGIAYYIGGKRVIHCSLVEALRDDTMM